MAKAFSLSRHTCLIVVIFWGDLFRCSDSSGEESNISFKLSTDMCSPAILTDNRDKFAELEFPNLSNQSSESLTDSNLRHLYLMPLARNIARYLRTSLSLPRRNPAMQWRCGEPRTKTKTGKDTEEEAHRKRHKLTAHFLKPATTQLPKIDHSKSDRGFSLTTVSACPTSPSIIRT